MAKRKEVCNKEVNITNTIAIVPPVPAGVRCVHLDNLLSAQNFRQYTHSAIYRANLKFQTQPNFPEMDTSWRCWTLADNWRTRAAFRFARANWEESIEDELKMLGKGNRPKWLEFISTLPTETGPAGIQPRPIWEAIFANPLCLGVKGINPDGMQALIDTGLYEASVVSANVDSTTGVGDEVMFTWDTQPSDPISGWLSIMHEYANRGTKQPAPAVVAGTAPYDSLHPMDVVEEDYLEIQQSSNNPPYDSDSLGPLFVEHQLTFDNGERFASTGMIDIPYGHILLTNKALETNDVALADICVAHCAKGSYHGVQATLV